MYSFSLFFWDMVYIGADHGGFHLKEEIKKWLMQEKIPVKDVGAATLDPSDDYPEFAHRVALNVSANVQTNLGIVICRSGAGVAIVANKTKNIRAVQVFTTTAASHARSNDNANIIALSGDWTTPEQAIQLIHVFLNTPFNNEERHQRRLDTITRIENQI